MSMASVTGNLPAVVPDPSGGRCPGDRRQGQPHGPALLAQYRTQLAVWRTGLADRRSHLANERTHLAYQRAAVSLISFGITLNRFAVFLEQQGTLAPGRGTRVVGRELEWPSNFARNGPASGARSRRRSEIVNWLRGLRFAKNAPCPGVETRQRLRGRVPVDVPFLYGAGAGNGFIPSRMTLRSTFMLFPFPSRSSDATLLWASAALST